MRPSSPICAITGASGYVGGRIRAHLEAAGWQVENWSRRTGPGGREFHLGQAVEPESFANAAALVHCAYDFTARRRDDIVTRNVRGSENLFRAAQAAGVGRIVFISSASAFAGCRSRYGQAKLEVEAIAQTVGAAILRPGLVYGDHPGGVFGNLVKQATRSRTIPLLGGQQVQYLVHDADLGEVVRQAVAGKIPLPSVPILVANETPWTMRQLLEHLAAAANRKPVLVPLPWRAVWLALRIMEGLRVPTPFRSDSLIGLMHPNPHPSLTGLKALGVSCRPFAVTPAMLA